MSNTYEKPEGMYHRIINNYPHQLDAASKQQLHDLLDFMSVLLRLLDEEKTEGGDRLTTEWMNKWNAFDEYVNRTHDLICSMPMITEE